MNLPITVFVLGSLFPLAASGDPPRPGAAASGYYAQPGAGEPASRTGRLVLGASLGLGGMADRGGDIECTNCNYNPLTLGLDAHVGVMLAPRFAIMLELQANGQVVESHDGGAANATLVQGAALAAAQVWVLPRLWLKGGLGFAHLQLDYDDAFGYAGNQEIANGGALLLGLGYEVLATPGVAVDVQGRLLVGTYGVVDDQITSATVGVGVSFY